MVQTVDFFTPIVDDPYDFGWIAAANALSDVYTMGARPVSALNIVGYPCRLGLAGITDILRGGADAVREAGAVIVGGHSIEDDEPKYGLAVTGLVNPAKMITNRGARPGMALILTKKLGTGIVNNIMKRKDSFTGGLTLRGSLPDGVFAEALTAMKRLNKAASAVMTAHHAAACTDVTGYGLLGHARNVAEASGVGMTIEYHKAPKYDGVEPLAIPGTRGGGERNHHWVAPVVDRHEAIDHNQMMLLCDAQTSGGLLIAVDADRADDLVAALHAAGDLPAAVIGHVTEAPPGRITLLP